MEHAPYDVSTLAEILIYDPDTGALTWKDRRPEHFVARHPSAQCARWNSRHAGRPAFTTLSDKGYFSTTIMGSRAQAHRVAWCLFHGISIGHDTVIDHINGNKTDNRIVNLRASSAAQNMMNAVKKRDGLRGAFFHKSTGRYQSSIRIHLGTFETEEEAAAAYENFAKALHGQFYLPDGSRPTVSRVP